MGFAMLESKTMSHARTKTKARKFLMRAFAQAERFVSELESRKLRAAYVFVGDEAFFRKRFRDAILEHLVPADLRDFSFFEFDLAETRFGRSS